MCTKQDIIDAMLLLTGSVTSAQLQERYDRLAKEHAWLREALAGEPDWLIDMVIEGWQEPVIQEEE
jgi:hypothetical protein